MEASLLSKKKRCVLLRCEISEAAAGNEANWGLESTLIGWRIVQVQVKRNTPYLSCRDAFSDTLQVDCGPKLKAAKESIQRVEALPEDENHEMEEQVKHSEAQPQNQVETEPMAVHPVLASLRSGSTRFASYLTERSRMNKKRKGAIDMEEQYENMHQMSTDAAHVSASGKVQAF